MPTKKTEPTIADQESQLYSRVLVTLKFNTPIAAGVPASQGLVAHHAKLYSAEVSNDMKASRKDVGEVSEDAIQEYIQRCSSVFYVDDDKGIYIRGYQFNAMLKDAAQRNKDTLRIRGLGNTIRDGGVLFPDRVYLGVPPTTIERVCIPEGRGATIKIFQVAEVEKLSVPCAVLNNNDLSSELFRTLWIVAQGIGLGSNRHLSYGRFEVESIQYIGGWSIADLFRQDGTVSGTSSPVPAEMAAD